ncbi:MAG: 50S ribosomal protein L21 [Candidatus Pacebacteria bacterium]|nr:50S ribosomal protein L21 [Candidatus Paceibacterota bacterium]
MLAVIKTGGKQYIVNPGKKIKIEKLDIEEGKNVTFDEVLLINDEKGTVIGDPVIKGATVTGKVLTQDRHEKVIIFKHKPKKRYRVKKGHRQPYTEVEISEIKSK